MVGGRERTEHARKGANKTNHVIGGLMTSYLIQDLSGFSPQIGRLVVMMSYARTTTLEAVKGLTREQLDHLHDLQSNSIGALLAHIAGVEFWYQLHTFEGRDLNAEERRRWSAALELGEKARREIRNQPLAHYIALQEEVRTRTLNEFFRRTDEWLHEQSLWGKANANNYFKWFHVFEDELNHRGQIRWLRKRLPEV